MVNFKLAFSCAGSGESPLKPAFILNPSYSYVKRISVHATHSFQANYNHFLNYFLFSNTFKMNLFRSSPRIAPSITSDLLFKTSIISSSIVPFAIR